MIYDYVVIGMGPTGLTLGLNLMDTDKKVLFVESEEEVGGCWKISYEEGYFKEHSPKVLSKSGTKEFNKLLKYLDVSPEYMDIYKKSTIISVLKTIMKQFMISDIIKFVFYVLFYVLAINNKSISVQEWCESKNISIKAQNYINIIAIAISNTYDKLTMHSFIQFTFRKYQYLFHLHQTKEPNKWISISYNRLKSNNNFSFMTKTSVKKFMIKDNYVEGLLTYDDETIVAKEYLCCIPIRSLYYMMNNSLNANWFRSMDQFKYFVEKSSYTGIGFQLHYDKYVQLPEEWCWSCFGDWKIIVVDKNISDEIQVLSCVIVDLDSKSRYIGKSVNECGSIEEIVKEGYRQVKNRGNMKIDPKKITISDNLYRSEFGWESINSSYSPSIGRLPVKGKIDNLYTIGPHNMDEVVIIDTAIESANKFVKKMLKREPIF